MSDENPPGGPPGPLDSGTGAPQESGGSAVDSGGLGLSLEGDAGEAYQQRIRLAEHRLAEVLGAYRQLRTENEGYRERITRNIERRYDQRRERLLLKFIDLLDNFDRALEAAETSYAGVPLVEGLILVRTQLLQTLQEEGLERIPVLGLPYDPNYSEAVQTRPVDDPDQHHIVVKEMIRGYRLNGRIARASQVVVGEYPQPTGAALTPAEPARAPVAPPPVTPAPPLEDGEEETDLEDIVARAKAEDAPPAEGALKKPRDDGED